MRAQPGRLASSHERARPRCRPSIKIRALTAVRGSIEPFHQILLGAQTCDVLLPFFSAPSHSQWHLASPRLVESEHGYSGTIDPKHIDDSASPNFHSLARIGSLMLLLITVFTGTASHAEPDSSKPPTLVFVCLHGSVKSQIAAAHFNRIARERGLSVTRFRAALPLITGSPQLSVTAWPVTGSRQRPMPLLGSHRNRQPLQRRFLPSTRCRPI